MPKDATEFIFVGHLLTAGHAELVFPKRLPWGKLYFHLHCLLNAIQFYVGDLFTLQMYYCPGFVDGGSAPQHDSVIGSRLK